ncbi:MAG: type II toxin-antitoxin system VapC family toxin [Oscillospiraceae bacterium]|nr:type II toxin-antitoxin system VapC family toxin [Oscillospiraceae bacterium]
MSGLDYLADTNAVLYLLSGNSCMAPYLGERLAVSVISVMELLSFPSITTDEERIIREFLDECEVFQISDFVKEQTIRIRRQYNVKLPDAIIAATAISSNLTLLTADTGIFKIQELNAVKLCP